MRAFIANYLADAEQPVSINHLSDLFKGDGPKSFYEELLGFPIHYPLSPEETQELRLKLHMKFARESEYTTMVKTHNAIADLNDLPTINPEATEGAIYIVRNPLDVAISYAHHYGQTYGEAIENLGSENNTLGGTHRQVLQYLGSWSQHVLSWTQAPGLKLHLMRYEDMLAQPLATFTRLVQFLELPVDSKRCKKAIRFCSFKLLTRQERVSGFVEAIPSKDHPAFRDDNVEGRPETSNYKGEDRIRFFRQGKAGAWRDVLTPEHVQRIINDHREAMERCGYLDETGSPTF